MKWDIFSQFGLLDLLEKFTRDVRTLAQLRLVSIKFLKSYELRIRTMTRFGGGPRSSSVLFGAIGNKFSLSIFLLVFFVINMTISKW